MPAHWRRGHWSRWVRLLLCCRTRVRCLRHRVLTGVRWARGLRRVSHWRRRVRGDCWPCREGDVLRHRRVLEATLLRRRAHRASLAHARRRCTVVVLSRRILDVALVRIVNVGPAGRSRVSSWRAWVVLRWLRLLRIAGTLFGWQICVSAHGDGLAARWSSRHVSVSSVQVPLLRVFWSRSRGKRFGKAHSYR